METVPGNRLHEPNVRQNADVIGWRDSRYWSPKLSITLGGEVSTNETALITSVTPPALMCAPPVALSKYELGVLSRLGRESRIFWATAACIASNIFGYLRGSPPYGIGLVGAGAQFIGAQAASLLGCSEFGIPVGQRRSWVEEKLAKECNRHHWPVLLSPPADSKSRIAANWMVDGSPKDCLMPLSDRDLPEGHSLHLVRSERHFGTLDYLGRAGSKVLPSYLHSVCRRRGAVFYKTRCPLLNMLHDLAGWFQEAGGERETVLRAAHLLQAYGFAEAEVGHENQPVNYVSWYDSIRFANWLNNGQGNGSTEIGAYTLGNLDPSGVPTNGPNIARNSGASVFLPSENEWYKAAYYDPGSSSYNLYPTSSNLVPTASVPTGASNSGNFNNAVVHLTAVGVYTSSASPYGTFDQGGNVWEWNEASKSGFLVPGDFPGTFRTLRGGAFDVIPDYLRASARIGNHETDEGSLVGFRVASIAPEPSSLVLAAFGIISLAAWSWRRRKW